jgi:hypothetical protein
VDHAGHVAFGQPRLISRPDARLGRGLGAMLLERNW